MQQQQSANTCQNHLWMRCGEILQYRIQKAIIRDQVTQRQIIE